jgi:hypothetical protein
MCLLLQWDVVDETDTADAHGGGENGRVERGHFDVVDIDAVELGSGALHVPGGECTRQSESSPTVLRGEQRIAR